MTALEELIEDAKSCGLPTITIERLMVALNYALQKEKEHIKKAVIEAYKGGVKEVWNAFENDTLIPTAEQYYNSKYK